MKEKKNRTFLIVLVIFVVIGIIGTQSEQVNSIPLIIGLIVLYLAFVLYKQGQGKEPNLVRKIQPLEKSVEEYIPNKIDDFILAKGERDNKVIIAGTPDFTKIKKFSKLAFVPESDNKDDNLAIKILLGDMILGYVDKNQTRDMIHNSLKNGHVYAVISEVDEKEKKIMYYIGFYGVSG